MDKELYEAAKAVRLRAHAPYSGFPVGVAIRTAGGTVHTGCNVENAAFPEGWCAETSAIGHMVSTTDAGGERWIDTVMVVASRIEGRLTTPCGGCRQRISEFGTRDTIVHCYDPDGQGATFRLTDLLPSSFDMGAIP